METIKLSVEKMHCASCGITIDETLEELDGVEESGTNVRKKICTVTYNPKVVNLENLVETIENLGYTAEKAKEKKSRWLR